MLEEIVAGHPRHGENLRGTPGVEQEQSRIDGEEQAVDDPAGDAGGPGCEGFYDRPLKGPKG
ncbi:hypothetical protein ACIRUL_15405 [Streptomyces sp. NPDC101171]|uniref:hypothetical protein n=1 Tax=Streptomyces sp. NPDC101171 TaxID=3366122 RepID=UPI0038140F4A